jgi:tetratricopeptide (TPR) repeat protein
MPRKHPESETIDKFLHGRLAARENLKLAWHLFNCASCRATVEEGSPKGPALLESLFKGMEPVENVETPRYDTAFSRTYSTLAERAEDHDRDRDRAPKLFLELMRHPVSRQRALLRRTWRFRTWAFAEHLLEKSRETWVDDPARAEDLAELALDVVEQLAASHYGPPLINDLRARAWSYIGNARRIGSDLRLAEEAFDKANKFFREGSKEPQEEARLLDLEASLRVSQGKFKEADRLIGRVLEAYRRTGDEHMVGRAMVSKARIPLAAGNPEESIPLLESALELIDPERDQRALFCAQQNLLISLCQIERYEEAQALLPKVRETCARLDNELDRVRLRWSEGRIALGLGHLEEAEGLFVGVRDKLVELGISYDAALASLDLARVYWQLGRTGDMKTLATEMLPIFQSRDVQREALAAFIVFRDALQMEQEVTLQMMQEITAKLQQARQAPELRFEQVS